VQSGEERVEPVGPGDHALDRTLARCRGGHDPIDEDRAVQDEPAPARAREPNRRGRLGAREADRLPYRGPPREIPGAVEAERMPWRRLGFEVGDREVHGAPGGGATRVGFAFRDRLVRPLVRATPAVVDARHPEDRAERVLLLEHRRGEGMELGRRNRLGRLEEARHSAEPERGGLQGPLQCPDRLSGVVPLAVAGAGHGVAMQDDGDDATRGEDTRDEQAGQECAHQAIELIPPLRRIGSRS
jgi:hypothetical protein